MRGISIVALTMLALAGVACGGDDDTGGSGGSSGSGGTGGGNTTLTCDEAPNEPNCINTACGNVSPTSGDRAMKGACCFRASNYDRARAAWDAGELATIEFRQNALKTTTQPGSVGNALIQSSLVSTYAQDWSNTMVRIEGIPESNAVGEPATVTVTIGAGRSNCDGTYSFFGNNGAIDHEGRTEASRWQAAVMTGTWDWNTPEKLHVAPEDRAPGVRWGPVAKDHGQYGYEQPSQDLFYEFEFDGSEGSDVTPEGMNCVGGELLSAGVWSSALKQRTFFPVARLKEAFVDSSALQQNFCAFMALGYMAAEMGVPLSCDDVPQDEWIEKPYGMCDDEHCYIGDEAHPDSDCNTTDKPCCDPSGLDTELEPCNAFLIEATAVMAGAEIAEAPYNGTMPFPDCTQ